MPGLSELGDSRAAAAFSTSTSSSTLPLTALVSTLLTLTRDLSSSASSPKRARMAAPPLICTPPPMLGPTVGCRSKTSTLSTEHGKCRSALASVKPPESRCTHHV
eukprot:16229-Heterococcus_DN1.PRE.1